MNKKEFFFGAIVVILGYVLFFLLGNRYIIMLIDLILGIFYFLYLKRKLPSCFYAKDADCKGWCSKWIIGSGIFYLFCCLLVCFFPSYMKIIGRIGFFSFLLLEFGVLFYAVVKKFFIGMPNSQFKGLVICYFRGILILISNVFLIPFFAYGYESYYQNGKLTRKIINDGRDVYETVYVDSISNYITNVQIRDEGQDLDYTIYYAIYPDSIDHIDTLRVY